jgi:hypothetical protein
MYVFDGSVEPGTVFNGGVANYAHSQVITGSVSLLIAVTLEGNGQSIQLDESVKGFSRNTLFLNIVVAGTIIEGILVLENGRKISRREKVAVMVQTVGNGWMMKNRRNPNKTDMCFPVTGLLCSKVATAPKHIPVAIKPIAVYAPKKWVSVPMGADSGPIGGVFDFDESNKNLVRAQD